jgi:hypothetical protein
MAKPVKEMIEVKEAYAKGGVIENNDPNNPFWGVCYCPNWDWSRYNYRVKKSNQNVMVEKWLIAMDGIKVVIEASDIDAWLKPFPTAQKLKLIESYEVEI